MTAAPARRLMRAGAGYRSPGTQFSAIGSAAPA